MGKKAEKVRHLVDEFVREVAENDNDSGLIDHQVEGLDIFGFLSLWNKSVDYALKTAVIEDKIRHLAVSADLETLVASLAYSKPKSRPEAIITEQLYNVMLEKIDNNELNVGDLKTISSFLPGHVDILVIIDQISLRKFGFDFNSREFCVALQSHKKELLGRKQSLPYGIFNLVCRHHYYLEKDELWPLREYLVELVKGKIVKPTFSEASRMWQKSARLPEISGVLEEFMCEEILAIDSSTPLDQLPNWFITALGNKQDMPSRVASVAAGKIRDIEAFAGVVSLGVVDAAVEPDLVVAREESASTVVVDGGSFWSDFGRELFDRFKDFFGASTKIPEPVKVS